MKLDFQLGNFIIHPTVQVVSLYWNHHAFGVFLLRLSLPLGVFVFWKMTSFELCSSTVPHRWVTRPNSAPLRRHHSSGPEKGRKGLHLRHISDYLSCQWLIRVMALKSSYKITINYSFNRDQSCIKMGFLSTRMLRYPGAFSLSRFLCSERKKERLNG